VSAKKKQAAFKSNKKPHSLFFWLMQKLWKNCAKKRNFLHKYFPQYFAQPSRPPISVAQYTQILSHNILHILANPPKFQPILERDLPF